MHMRMDPSYEAEEMETNMESMFEHVNEMLSTDMPRDFLASMSKYFFREEGEKFSMFQKMQREAVLLLEQSRPHWRKRKQKSASQFLTMFYLVEKEVLESEDEVVKSLFVEAFHSREAYIETVMEEFDETDRIEEQMSSGTVFDVPGYVYDDDDGDNVHNTEGTNRSKEFDLEKTILEVSELISGMDQLDISKYVKIFEKDGDW